MRQGTPSLTLEHDRCLKSVGLISRRLGECTEGAWNEVDWRESVYVCIHTISFLGMIQYLFGHKLPVSHDNYV